MKKIVFLGLLCLGLTPYFEIQTAAAGSKDEYNSSETSAWQTYGTHEVFLNCYAVLGVEKTADDKTIKKAYRKKSMKYHPDRPNGDEEKFKLCSTAYDTLSHYKETYDKEYDRVKQGKPISISNGAGKSKSVITALFPKPEGISEKQYQQQAFDHTKAYVEKGGARYTNYNQSPLFSALLPQQKSDLLNFVTPKQNDVFDYLKRQIERGGKKADPNYYTTTSVTSFQLTFHVLREEQQQELKVLAKPLHEEYQNMSSDDAFARVCDAIEGGDRYPEYTPFYGKVDSSRHDELTERAKKVKPSEELKATGQDLIEGSKIEAGIDFIIEHENGDLIKRDRNDLIIRIFRGLKKRTNQYYAPSKEPEKLETDWAKFKHDRIMLQSHKAAEDSRRALLAACTIRSKQRAEEIKAEQQEKLEERRKKLAERVQDRKKAEALQKKEKRNEGMRQWANRAKETVRRQQETVRRQQETARKKKELETIFGSKMPQEGNTPEKGLHFLASLIKPA